MGGDLYHSQRWSKVEVNQHLHSNHPKSLDHHGSQKDHLFRVFWTKKETFLNKTSPLPKTHFPEIVPMHQLKHVHPLVLNLFSKKEIRNFPLAGRLQYFLDNWEILTNDPKILECVSRLKIDFQEEPFQERVPHQAQISMQESELINQVVEAMLRKGGYSPSSLKRQSIFKQLVPSSIKWWGNRPVINLKALNLFISYSLFQMEG